MSLLAPIYTSLTKLYAALYSRASKLDYLDAATTSRLSSTDARLNNLDATIASRVATADTRLATLDAAITSRLSSTDSRLNTLDAAITTRAAAADYTSGRAAKLDYLDAAISGLAAQTATNVWAHESRDLTQFFSLRFVVLTSGSVWTVPVGVSAVIATVIGGGGGAGGFRTAIGMNNFSAGYGGNGGYIFRYPLAVNGTVNYRVGAGGAGGTAGVAGSAGGSTTFGNLSVSGGAGGTVPTTSAGITGDNGTYTPFGLLWDILDMGGSLTTSSSPPKGNPGTNASSTTVPGTVGGDGTFYGYGGGPGGLAYSQNYTNGGNGGSGASGAIILEYYS